VIIPIAEQRETQRYPVVTVTLIGLNVLVFLAEQFMDDATLKSFCYIPSHPTLLTSFTSMFLHGGFWHIFGNMLFLWMVGPNIEEAFTPLGMLTLYLVAGVFADFAHAHMISAAMMDVPTLGASGAIAGLMGASIVIFPRSKVTFWYWILWFWTGTFQVEAFWAIGAWFVQQFILNMVDDGGGVAYGAHIGGFGLSAVVAMLFVLMHLVEPHWDRPESWPQRYRPAGPELSVAEIEAQKAILHEQHIRTARVLGVAFLVVILVSVSVKGAVAYHAYRISQQVHYQLVVASDKVPALEADLRQVSGVTDKPHAHTSYQRTQLSSYWAGVELNTDSAGDKVEALTVLGYPASLEAISEDDSLLHLQKTFPNPKAATHAAKAVAKRTHDVIELAAMPACRIVAVSDTMLDITVSDAAHTKPLQDLIAAQHLSLVELAATH
jgi:membrane associated rhomboid family serine protease